MAAEDSSRSEAVGIVECEGVVVQHKHNAFTGVKAGRRASHLLLLLSHKERQ